MQVASITTVCCRTTSRVNNLKDTFYRFYRQHRFLFRILRLEQTIHKQWQTQSTCFIIALLYITMGLTNLGVSMGGLTWRKASHWRHPYRKSALWRLTRLSTFSSTPTMWSTLHVLLLSWLSRENTTSKRLWSQQVTPSVLFLNSLRFSSKLTLWVGPPEESDNLNQTSLCGNRTVSERHS